MARTTIRGFSKRIRAIAQGVETNAAGLVRKTVITAAAAVALRTPVDTGRARANWQTQLGAAPVGEATGYPRGTQGSTGAAAAAQAIAGAEAAAQGYTEAHSGTPVYISNSLPYIGRLNAGHSKQAPAGFVEAAIEAAVRAIKKARLVK